MKKCTPSSNTECRKRDLSPAEPSQASPTANPSLSSDISNSPAVLDRAATRRARVTFQYTDVFCRSLLPVLSVAITMAVVIVGLLAWAVWWFRQHSSEIPCELSVNSIVKAVFCPSVLMPTVCGETGIESNCNSSQTVKICIVSFAVRTDVFCVTAVLKTDHPPPHVSLSRARVNPPQKRGRIIRTPVWRGRSPGQSSGLCCRRPSPG